jgi:hypothetical protein
MLCLVILTSSVLAFLAIDPHNPQQSVPAHSAPTITQAHGDPAATPPSSTPPAATPSTSDPLPSQHPPQREPAQPTPTPASKPALTPTPDQPPLRNIKKTANLLLNPDFEATKLEWWSFAEKNTESWVDFSIVPEKGRNQSKAARLLIDSTTRTAKTGISGVVQEVKGDHVPEKLSGWYFVESWDKHTPKLYLQAVVIVWNDTEARQRQLVNAPSIQIAYTFTGVKEAPKVMTNRKFIVLGDETPKVGEWVHFEVNPRQDFVKLWKIDPAQYEFIRIFFELRYDDMESGSAPTKSTAYYDDLYFGD